MLTKQKEIELPARRLAEYTVALFSSEQLQVANKLETVAKKAQKVYQNFPGRVSTGSLVEDDFDFKVKVVRFAHLLRLPRECCTSL